MLQSKRNELTLSILQKLKRKGLPKAESDKTLMGDAEVADEEVSPDGTMLRSPLSVPNLPSRKRQKSLLEDE